MNTFFQTTYKKMCAAAAMAVGVTARASAVSLALLAAVAVMMWPVALQAQLPGGSTAKNKGLTVDVKDVDEYPQEAAVVEHYFRSYRYENDGSATTKTRVEYRVQSDAGVQQLGVLQLAYNSVSDEVKIEYVHVRKKDGVVINTPTESAQEATTNVSQVAPMYTDMKIRYLPVVGLRPGDTLEYEYITTTKKPVVPNQFFLTENFEKNLIVKDEVLEVDVPAARKIKLKMEPGATPEIKEAGGRRVYRWHHANLKRKEPPKKGEKPEEEEDDDDQAPSIQLSSFESWDEVGRWYYELQSSRLTVSPEMQAKVAELTKGVTGDQEKIAKIYDFVSKEFRYIGLEFGVGRYQPHDAAEVYASRYGDCKDKHTLLAAMLKAAGYNALPVLINASRKMDVDMPSPSQFDHVISLVKLPSREIWMDTTPEVAPFGMLMGGLRKKNALVVQADGAKVTETPADLPFPTEATLDVDGSINDLGKLDAKIKQSWRGDLEVILRAAFRRTPEAHWKELAQNLSYAEGWAGDVTELKASDPAATDRAFGYSYNYSREQYVDWSAATGEMTIALTSIGMPSPPDANAKKVKAIPLGGQGEFVRRARVRMPEGTNVFPPESVHLVRDYAEYHATYKFQDGVFIAERKLVVKSREVAPSQEADYQGFYRDVMKDESRQVNVWRKAGGIAAVPTGTTADELLDAGKNALRTRDFPTAIKVFQRLTELEPKHQTAWAGLGEAEMSTMKVDDAIKAFRKQMEVNPSHENAYLMLATALDSQAKYDDAEKVLIKRLETDPKNSRARMVLAGIFVEAGRSKDAVPHLETLLKDYPDDQNLQLKLATAYLESGDKEKALPEFDVVIKSNPTALMKNNVAYVIAEKSPAYDKAEEYAKSALAMIAERLNKADLRQLSNDDLAQNSTQLATWDTLGWIYKKEGKLKEAEDYIQAAWMLRQDREVADHLAEIYHLEGKKDDEERIRLAASTLMMPAKNLAEAMSRVKAAKQSQEDDRPILTRNARGEESKTGKAAPRASSSQLLQDMRTITVSRKLKKTASADIFFLFSGSGVDDISFVNGEDEFKGWTEMLKKLDYKMKLPGNEKTKVIRRGVLSCAEYNGECMLVMLPQVVSVN